MTIYDLMYLHIEGDAEIIVYGCDVDCSVLYEGWYSDIPCADVEIMSWYVWDGKICLDVEVDEWNEYIEEEE